MKTMIWGHRGYPKKFPENSLQGFRFALSKHIEGIEFDVHLTRDNVPVIIHDENIQRTTNGSGFVGQFSLSELKKFKLSNGESIPTLDEFLSLVSYHDVHLNLEFKTDIIDYYGIEEIVLNKVNNYKLRYPIIYSSFNLKTLRKCYSISNKENYCYLTKWPILHPQEFINREHLSGLHLHFYQKIPHNIIERIWTVNSISEAIMLFNKHVDGIFTNDFITMSIIRNNVFKNENP